MKKKNKKQRLRALLNDSPVVKPTPPTNPTTPASNPTGNKNNGGAPDGSGGSADEPEQPKRKVKPQTIPK